MRTRFAFGTAVLVAVLGVVAACGGDDAAVESTVLSIVGAETKDDAEVGGYALEGDDVVSPGPTLRVRAGERVTINFKNVHGRYFGETGISHNFLVTATKEEQAKPLWGAAVGENPPGSNEDETDEWLSAGESGSATFTPEAPGAYFYICSLPGHIARGMWGRFVVEE